MITQNRDAVYPPQPPELNPLPQADPKFIRLQTRRRECLNTANRHGAIRRELERLAFTWPGCPPAGPVGRLLDQANAFEDRWNALARRYERLILQHQAGATTTPTRRAA